MDLNQYSIYAAIGTIGRIIENSKYMKSMESTKMKEALEWIELNYYSG